MALRQANADNYVLRVSEEGGEKSAWQDWKTVEHPVDLAPLKKSRPEPHQRRLGGWGKEFLRRNLEVEELPREILHCARRKASRANTKLTSKESSDSEESIDVIVAV